MWGSCRSWWLSCNWNNIISSQLSEVRKHNEYLYVYYKHMHRCNVCQRNMEGQQVTLDKNNKVYCAQDYDRYILYVLSRYWSGCIRKFCSKCAVCNKAIVPRKGETKVQKLRALGKDFHLQCFKCEVSKPCWIWK